MAATGAMAQMNLGSLVTIANAAPRNLIHFICENGVYFLAMAQGARSRRAFAFSEVAAFAAERSRVLQLKGPTFATLKPVPGKTPLRIDYRWMHGVTVRADFKRALLPLVPTKARS